MLRAVRGVRAGPVAAMIGTGQRKGLPLVRAELHHGPVPREPGTAVELPRSPLVGRVTLDLPRDAVAPRHLQRDPFGQPVAAEQASLHLG